MTIKNRYFWIAAFIALVLDQLTKYWVLQSLELCDLSAPREFCDNVPVWDGVFHFIYVTNPGAAWSIGANLPYFPIFLRVLSMLVSFVLVLVGVFVSGMNRWEQVGYGCVLGGAFGNGLDRLAAGEVIDFLDFRLINFPVFNIADVAINVGIICLLIGFWVSSNGNGRRKNGDHYRS